MGSIKQDVHTLPSGIVMDSNKDGWICLTGIDGEQIVTSASELVYIIQHYQDTWRGIPVKIDFSQWRGMYGTSEKT